MKGKKGGEEKKGQRGGGRGVRGYVRGEKREIRKRKIMSDGKLQREKKREKEEMEEEQL